MLNINKKKYFSNYLYYLPFYKDKSNPQILSPFEKIGDGITIRGRNSAKYGALGYNAFDMSDGDPYADSSVRGATGQYSWLFGEDNIASGWGAGGAGYLLDLSGTFSIGFGYDLKSNAYATFSYGLGNINNGYFSYVGGTGNNNNGTMSFLQGQALDNANSVGCFIIGQANKVFNGSGNLNDLNDYSFIIGNGSISQPPGNKAFANSRDNALTVKKKGELFIKESIGIGVEDPNSNLQINGSVSKKVIVNDGSTPLPNTINLDDSMYTIVHTAQQIVSYSLPSTAICDGREYVIKNLSSTDVYISTNTNTDSFDNGFMNIFTLQPLSSVTLIAVSNINKWIITSYVTSSLYSN